MMNNITPRKILLVPNFLHYFLFITPNTNTLAAWEYRIDNYSYFLNPFAPNAK